MKIRLTGSNIVVWGCCRLVLALTALTAITVQAQSGG
jgi:hypothetical protein